MNERTWTLWRLRDVLVQLALQRAAWATWDYETYGGWWPR